MNTMLDVFFSFLGLIHGTLANMLFHVFLIVCMGCMCCRCMGCMMVL